MKISIRKISTDASFLEALALLGQFGGNARTVAKGPTREPLRNWRRAAFLGYTLYGAYADKHLVGVMGLLEVRDPLNAQPSFRINNLIVDKAQRGQGIGTALLRFAETLAKKSGGQSLVLEVFPQNKKAISFYKKNLGYQLFCSRMLKML